MKYSFILLIGFAFVLTGLNARAQHVSIQTVIDKLQSFQSFSYRRVDKLKDFAADTQITRQKDVFVKAPADKVLGYHFSSEVLNSLPLPVATIYNGQHLTILDFNDSTYQQRDAKPMDMQTTLPGRLDWIKGFVAKNPNKVAQVADTATNGAACFHLVINTRDTVINSEHFYTRIHVFVDKQNDMPKRILTVSRNADIGNAISNYYWDAVYADYRFNQDDIPTAEKKIPAGFHPPTAHNSQPLLLNGSAAPQWTLNDVHGKKISLAQLKGKVILLDYFFIGCYPCMQSLKPLNRLHQKYQHKNLVILSITERDNEKSVAAFRKQYNINYPIYTHGADMVKAYHVEGFPTFCIIDQQGNIAASLVGYSDEFETKVSGVIDGLLKKL